MTYNVPVVRPKPDAGRFMDILMGRVRDPRPPLVEYIVDEVVMRPIVTDLLGREWVSEVTDRKSQRAYFDNFIAFWHRMGYDFVRFETGLPFVENRIVAADPAPGSNKQRAWSNQHVGTIKNWDDFERYPWPKIEDTDFFLVEYINSHLPEGMGLMSCHAGGVFEHTSAIMSIEGLCMTLCQQPDLVKAVADRVGGLLKEYHRHLLDLDNLIAVFQGDDMGFRTGPLIGPDDMRNYFLVWHKQYAEQAHAHGRPYFVHSCGNVETLMEYLISEARLDGKHSFEDAIMPVQHFQAKYGDRIAVLGGLDINILSAGTPDDVRRHTRFLMETCGGRGRYAIGSGNSIPSYVPLENYLAMLDEALSG